MDFPPRTASTHPEWIVRDGQRILVHRKDEGTPESGEFSLPGWSGVKSEVMHLIRGLFARDHVKDRPDGDWLVARDSYLSRIGVTKGHAVRVRYLNDNYGIVSVAVGDGTTTNQRVSWERFADELPTPDTPRVETPAAVGNRTRATEAKGVATAERIQAAGGEGKAVVADGYLRKHGYEPGDVVDVRWESTDRASIVSADGSRRSVAWARFSDDLPPGTVAPNVAPTEQVVDPSHLASKIRDRDRATLDAVSGMFSHQLDNGVATRGVAYYGSALFPGDDGLEVSGVITRDGAVVGNFLNRVEAVDGADGPRLVVHMDSITLNRDHQGQGVGSTIFAASVDAYRKAGVDRVDLLATSGDATVGAYVWAKAGFDWDRESRFAVSSIQKIGELMVMADNESVIGHALATWDGRSDLPSPYEVASDPLGRDVLLGNHGVVVWPGVMRLSGVDEPGATAPVEAVDDGAAEAAAMFAGAPFYRHDRWGDIRSEVVGQDQSGDRSVISGVLVDGTGTHVGTWAATVATVDSEPVVNIDRVDVAPEAQREGIGVAWVAAMVDRSLTDSTAAVTVNAVSTPRGDDLFSQNNETGAYLFARAGFGWDGSGSGLADARRVGELVLAADAESPIGAALARADTVDGPDTPTPSEVAADPVGRRVLMGELGQVSWRGRLVTPVGPDAATTEPLDIRSRFELGNLDQRLADDVGGLFEHDLGDGYRSEVNAADVLHDSPFPAVEIVGRIVSPSGGHAAVFKRVVSWNASTGGLEVDHDNLDVLPELRRQGLGSRFIAASLDAYRSVGVDRVRALATSSSDFTDEGRQTGAYVWARAGFGWDWDSEAAVSAMHRIGEAMVDGGDTSGVGELLAGASSNSRLDPNFPTPTDVADTPIGRSVLLGDHLTDPGETLSWPGVLVPSTHQTPSPRPAVPEPVVVPPSAPVTVIQAIERPELPRTPPAVSRQTLESVFTHDLGDGMTSELVSVDRIDAATIDAHGKLNVDGTTAGWWTRRVTTGPDGSIDVRNTFISINDGYMGRGAGTRFAAASEDAARAAGFDTVTVDASSSPDVGMIGAYVWATSGFDWDTSPESVDLVRTLGNLILEEDEDSPIGQMLAGWTGELYDGFPTPLDVALDPDGGEVLRNTEVAWVGKRSLKEPNRTDLPPVDIPASVVDGGQLVDVVRSAEPYRQYPDAAKERIRREMSGWYDADLGDGWRSETVAVTFGRNPLGDNGIVADGKIVAPDGATAGTWTRKLRVAEIDAPAERVDPGSDLGDTVLVVDHDVFALDQAHQGRGVGARFVAASRDAYKRSGVAGAVLPATSDATDGPDRQIGAYAWAASGADWAPGNIDPVHAIAEAIREHDPESALAALMLSIDDPSDPDLPTPFDVAADPTGKRVLLGEFGPVEWDGWFPSDGAARPPVTDAGKAKAGTPKPAVETFHRPVGWFHLGREFQFEHEGGVVAGRVVGTSTGSDGSKTVTVKIEDALRQMTVNPETLDVVGASREPWTDGGMQVGDDLRITSSGEVFGRRGTYSDPEAQKVRDAVMRQVDMAEMRAGGQTVERSDIPTARPIGWFEAAKRRGETVRVAARDGTRFSGQVQRVATTTSRTGVVVGRSVTLYSQSGEQREFDLNDIKVVGAAVGDPWRDGPIEVRLGRQFYFVDEYGDVTNPRDSGVVPTRTQQRVRNQVLAELADVEAAQTDWADTPEQTEPVSGVEEATIPSQPFDMGTYDEYRPDNPSGLTVPTVRPGTVFTDWVDRTGSYVIRSGDGREWVTKPVGGGGASITSTDPNAPEGRGSSWLSHDELFALGPAEVIRVVSPPGDGPVAGAEHLLGEIRSSTPALMAERVGTAAFAEIAGSDATPAEWFTAGFKERARVATVEGALSVEGHGAVQQLTNMAFTRSTAWKHDSGNRDNSAETILDTPFYLLDRATDDNAVCDVWSTEPPSPDATPYALSSKQVTGALGPDSDPTRFVVSKRTTAEVPPQPFAPPDPPSPETVAALTAGFDTPPDIDLGLLEPTGRRGVVTVGDIARLVDNTANVFSPSGIGKLTDTRGRRRYGQVIPTAAGASGAGGPIRRVMVAPNGNVLASRVTDIETADLPEGTVVFDIGDDRLPAVLAAAAAHRYRADLTAELRNLRSGGVQGTGFTVGDPVGGFVSRLEDRSRDLSRAAVDSGAVFRFDEPTGSWVPSPDGEQFTADEIKQAFFEEAGGTTRVWFPADVTASKIGLKLDYSKVDDTSASFEDRVAALAEQRTVLQRILPGITPAGWFGGRPDDSQVEALAAGTAEPEVAAKARRATQLEDFGIRVHRLIRERYVDKLDEVAPLNRDATRDAVALLGTDGNLIERLRSKAAESPSITALLGAVDEPDPDSRIVISDVTAKTAGEADMSFSVKYGPLDTPDRYTLRFVEVESDGSVMVYDPADTTSTRTTIAADDTDAIDRIRRFRAAIEPVVEAKTAKRDAQNAERSAEAEANRAAMLPDADAVSAVQAALAEDASTGARSFRTGYYAVEVVDDTVKIGNTRVWLSGVRQGKRDGKKTATFTFDARPERPGLNQFELVAFEDGTLHLYRKGGYRPSIPVAVTTAGAAAYQQLAEMAGRLKRAAPKPAREVKRSTSAAAGDIPEGRDVMRVFHEVMSGLGIDMGTDETLRTAQGVTAELTPLSEANPKVRHAATLGLLPYPKSWTERLAKTRAVRVILRSGMGRSRYAGANAYPGFGSKSAPDADTIETVDPDVAMGYLSTWGHEFGHSMQRAIPGLAEAEEWYMVSRLASTADPNRRKPRKYKGGDKKDVTYEDEWGDSYTGRLYGGGLGSATAHEVITTAVQGLYEQTDVRSHKDREGFASDPRLIGWFIGLAAAYDPSVDETPSPPDTGGTVDGTESVVDDGGYTADEVAAMDVGQAFTVNGVTVVKTENGYVDRATGKPVDRFGLPLG